MIYSSTKIIKNAIQNNCLSHAYLFYGDNGVDIEQDIFQSIKLIIESTGKKINAKNINEIKYFDFKIIEPNKEQKIITKESVDSIIDNLYETSLEKSKIKILYIKDIDQGNKFSLNRLLKFIEEPVENLIILISTNHLDKVIPTIKSRAQNVFIKRQNLDEKISLFKKNIDRNFALIANIIPNTETLKKMDVNLFNQTYDELIDILENAYKTPFLFKDKMFKLWTKNNNYYLISILQFFFYQLMIEIDLKNPLFEKKENLIFEYKKKNINSFKIQFMIDELKKTLNSHGNFNLQKINFLNKLEEEIKL